MKEDINDNTNNETEDNSIVLEKDKSRSLKIKRDWHKAKARFNRIKNICNKNLEHSLGYFRNNNEANANTSNNKKTNTRKSSTAPHNKGGYGKANKYSPKDKRQLEDMNEEMEEFNEKEEI